MREYMAASGLPHRLTSGQRGPRYAGDSSLHIVGRGADFAGPQPSWNSPELKAIWEYWMRVAGSLHELIYSGAPYYISRGQVKPIAQLSPSLRKAHWNHVHVGVPVGWTAPKEIIVPDQPVVRINGHAISISTIADSEGKLTGYLILGSDGGVFGFGPGAGYFGRVENGDGTK